MSDEFGLSERQRRFCDYYMASANGTEAAIMADYSKKNARFTASKLLKRPEIKQYIASRMKYLADHRVAKAEEVLSFLTSSMRGEIKEEVVVVEGIGEGCSSATIVKKQIGANDRLKAAALLAKRYGLDKPDSRTEEDSGGVTIIDDTDKT